MPSKPLKGDKAHGRTQEQATQMSAKSYFEETKTMGDSSASHSDGFSAKIDLGCAIESQLRDEESEDEVVCLN